MDAMNENASHGDRVADALVIGDCAAMDEIDYGRNRAPTAKRLGIPVRTLDALVAKARASSEPPRFRDPDDIRPPEFSDDGLALRFAAKHADRLRYVAAWSQWMIWEAGIWRNENTLRAFDLARVVCRDAASRCDQPKAAAALASSKTVAAVSSLARADRRIAATIDQWDADPWLLNTPGGVVDLRTGTMRQHRPDDFMTKITAVAPGGECPLWHQFLARITGGNGELHDSLQRAMGYALTGSTREHALFFGYGTGANGKGTFLNTMTGIFGSYAAVAPMETFTASSGERHPADMAMLRGARLVAAQETEEGKRWAESKIKALTGGDPITARFMRQDFFTFTPLFKLFIAGNHKPGLRGVDEAMRRRLNLIPFTVTIPAAERDHTLPERLKAEWPGILAWAIEGCLHWQRTGLRTPAAVIEATTDYLDAEDSLGLWIDECCERASAPDPTESSKLFASWKQWAESAGETPGSHKRFSQALQSKGFIPRRMTGGKSGFDGIRFPVPRPKAETTADRE